MPLFTKVIELRDRLDLNEKFAMWVVASLGLLLALFLWGGREVVLRAADEQVVERLRSIRESKAREIESYFKEIRAQAATFSEDSMVTTALQEFRDAFDGLAARPELESYCGASLSDYYMSEFLPQFGDVETPNVHESLPIEGARCYLQYHYISANPEKTRNKARYVGPDPTTGDAGEYFALHQKYHPIFRNYLERFGYYDIFLISLDGDIVYTVSKEVDFATNLQFGPYRLSNLGQLFARFQLSEAIEPGFVRLRDFEPYTPSYEAPASFIASGIFGKDEAGNPEMIGVLAFQMPMDRINSVMTYDETWLFDGLGYTGETFLVATQGGEIRSDTRFDPQPVTMDWPRVVGPTEQGEFEENAAEEVIREEWALECRERCDAKSTSTREPLVSAHLADLGQGKGFGDWNPDYRERDSIIAYRPLDIEGVSWQLIAKLERSEAFEAVSPLLWLNGIAFVVLLMLVGILLFGLSWATSARVGKWTAVLSEILGQEANAELRGRTGPFTDLDRRMSQFIRVVEANRSAIEQASQGDLEWSLVARPDPLSIATEALRKHLEAQASQETERAE